MPTLTTRTTRSRPRSENFVPPEPHRPRWRDHRPAEWSPAWFPPPSWGTERDPAAKTYGGAAGLIAGRKLGRPFLPWQQHVADVALEIEPATGRLRYRQVVVTVPRQSGKTTGLLFPVMVLRCTHFGARQRVVYTAQDRNSAREKFEEEFIEILHEAPGYVEGRDYTIRKANGSEAITFLGTRSTVKISATLDNSGHGRTLDMPGIDEAFEHKTTNVEQGFRVPMITRPEPQLWVLSTKGDETSRYLERKVQAGRASVEDPGSVSGVAYFEWTVDDPAADLHDRRLWWFVMPALGHTITEDAVAVEMGDMDPADARRAYYNVTQDRRVEEPSPINLDDWGGVKDRNARHEGPLVYGLDVAPGSTRAAVGVAGARAGGGHLVEVIDVRPGTRWAPQFLAEVIARNGGEGVAVDPGSEAGALIPDLEKLGVEVFLMNARQHAQACGALLARIPTGELFHLGQSELDAAVVGAKTRTLSDAWAWDRKKPDDDIAPLVAVTLALGALLNLQPPEEDNDVTVYEERGFVEW